MFEMNTGEFKAKSIASMEAIGIDMDAYKAFLDAQKNCILKLMITVKFDSDARN